MNQLQRTCNLIIDEIYVGKRVEYFGGKLEGLTAEGEVASTILCFMIKSLCHKYRDVVSIYPVKKLMGLQMFEYYNEVMDMLKKLNVHVIGITVDNAAVNRNFFVHHLCGGVMKTKIEDLVNKQPTYLLFDSVHNLKNIFNNFLNRKQFNIPSFKQQTIDFPACTANFSHIEELYKLEVNMLVKKAHKLSNKLFSPSNIDKISVKLAAAVFSESTRDAFKYYVVHHGRTEWSGTANFIELITKLWQVMNVKTCSK